MKRILINDNELSLDDIDYEVIRVKGIVMNSNSEVILVENNNTFQFPGGHIRKEESLESCLKREIKEELGINLDIEEGPFMMLTTYDNNYFNTGSKVCSKIYYYVILSDIEPDLNNLSLDALEKETEFNILKINISSLEEFLTKCLNDGSIDPNIGREMLLVIKEYNELYGGIR